MARRLLIIGALGPPARTLMQEILMKALGTISLGLAMAGLLSMSATADTGDVWLTTKCKIALLTTEGLSVRGVNVDTIDGAVTLHGKVKTEAEKEKAGQTVRAVEGVKHVRNLLQVVPDVFKQTVKASDEVLKDRVQMVLKTDKSLEGVNVASVNNGVVLLSGKAPTFAEKLRAIELAWNVDGVSRVASEIEVAK
ncbi:MAG: BON domain-containing protein [Vicinamibacteria bacterium]